MSTTTKSYAAVVWLTLAAIAVPVWAIAQQYRTVSIEARAEDDCPYFYGAYALDRVEGFDRGAFHAVRCVYK